MAPVAELDPEIREFLAGAAPLPQWWLDHDIFAARLAYRQRSKAYPPGPEMPTEDLGIDGPNGHQIPIRIYRPVEQDGGPVVLYMHGGGWSVGDIAFSDPHVRRVAVTTGATFVSVDYRLAPECPYPAGVDDCWTALTWLADHAGELGVDPDRLGVAGDSAGATNAAVLSLLSRDHDGPPIKAQCLWYPGFLLQPEVPSMADPSREVTLTAAACRTFRTLYAGSIEGDLPATLSPVSAEDLSGMPPTIVAASGVDPLYDEMVSYAERLEAAGCEVELSSFHSLPHGYVSLAGWLPVLEAAVADTAERFRRLLG